MLGVGPGGYSADLDVCILMLFWLRHPTLGGVCLNEMYPSKALLHVVKVIDEAKHINHAGIKFI